MTFRLGPIPVKVTLWFLLVSVMFAQGGRGDPAEMRAKLTAIWVAVVFVSVLVHELGHALMGRAFGLVPQIELHGMGGTTSWQNGRDVGPWKSIAISLAGPFAGFLLGGLVLLAGLLGFAPKNYLAVRAYEMALWVNIGWGVVNLVPMLPLDGGNVMRSFLGILTKGRGEKPARVVSIVFCALVGAFALYTHWLWIGLMAGLFAMSNIQAMRAISQAADEAPLAEAVAQAYLALERQDGAAALDTLRGPLSTIPASPDLRQNALRLYAYALLIEGHWGELMPLLERERSAIGPEELDRYARTARELGRNEEADRIDAMQRVDVAALAARG